MNESHGELPGADFDVEADRIVRSVENVFPRDSESEVRAKILEAGRGNKVLTRLQIEKVLAETDGRSQWEIDEIERAIGRVEHTLDLREGRRPID